MVVVGAQQHRHDAGRGLDQGERVLDKLPRLCIRRIRYNGIRADRVGLL
jgi:hypothetical protein